MTTKRFWNWCLCAFLASMLGFGPVTHRAHATIGRPARGRAMGAATAMAQGATLFSDVTDTALDKPFIHARSALDVFGLDTLAPASQGPNKELGFIGGLAIADFNGDGWNDIFVPNGKGGRNALYINERSPDIRLRDVADIAGVEFPGGESGGVVAGDINNDGLIDIYVSNVGILWPPTDRPGVPAGSIMNVPSSNRLFINMGNDKNGIPIFQERAAATGAAGSPFARYQQPALVDFDGDGDLDIYIGAHNPVVFTGLPSDTRDYPNKRANRDTGILLRNNLKETGALSFTDVTDLLRTAVDAAGNLALAQGENECGKPLDGQPFFNSRFTFDGVWVDYDNDGDPDLLMANDLNVLGVFRNEGGKGFTYLSPETGFVKRGAYMSMTPGDINGDGWFDFFATNVGGPTSTACGTFTEAQYVLHLNKGRDERGIVKLIDVAKEVAKEDAFPAASLANPRFGSDTSGDFGWGAVMFDYDNDGDLDLLEVGNWWVIGSGVRDGVIQNITDRAALNAFLAAGRGGGHTNVGHLFRNDGVAPNGNPILVDLSAPAGAAKNVVGIFNPYDARSLAVGDLNNDGFLDFAIVNMSGGATTGGFPVNGEIFHVLGSFEGGLKVYKNNGKDVAETRNNNALIVRLHGTRSNAAGIGARVVVELQGKGKQPKTQMREAWSNEGHMSSSSRELAFGLGDFDEVKSITVNWPGGKKQTIDGFIITQQRIVLDIVEPGRETNPGPQR